MASLMSTIGRKRTLDQLPPQPAFPSPPPVLIRLHDHPIPAATLIVVGNRVGAPPDLPLIERAAKLAFAGGAMSGEAARN